LINTVAPSVDEEVIKALQKNPLQFKAGQTGRIKIPVNGGHPPPTITWEKDGKPLKGNWRISHADGFLYKKNLTKAL